MNFNNVMIFFNLLNWMYVKDIKIAYGVSLTLKEISMQMEDDAERRRMYALITCIVTVIFDIFLGAAAFVCAAVTDSSAGYAFAVCPKKLRGCWKISLLVTRWQCLSLNNCSWIAYWTSLQLHLSFGGFMVQHLHIQKTKKT